MRGIFKRYPDFHLVIVNLKSGTSFKGVIWRHVKRYIVLRGVVMLSDRGTQAKTVVDGEVLVNLADVDFIQVVE